MVYQIIHNRYGPIGDVTYSQLMEWIDFDYKPEELEHVEKILSFYT